MRRSSPGAQPLPATGDRHDWDTIKKLIPYLWAYKWRVLFALTCLISAKFANVSVPLVFKQLVDGLDISREQAFIVVPAAVRTQCFRLSRRQFVLVEQMTSHLFTIPHDRIVLVGGETRQLGENVELAVDSRCRHRSQPFKAQLQYAPLPLGDQIISAAGKKRRRCISPMAASSTRSTRSSPWSPAAG